MSIGVKLSFAAETYRRVASPGWTARAGRRSGQLASVTRNRNALLIAVLHDCKAAATERPARNTAGLR